jgi:hypothetical protein
VAVVAKLFVSSVKRQVSAPDTVEVTLGAVTRGEANRSWAEATPAASFQLTIQNPEASAQFSLGQEFLVTFEPDGAAPSLADGHAYEPGDYEKSNPTQYTGTYRCATCNAKRVSHDEPLRSQIVKQMGVG